ncbi:MAG: hypothetical protein ABII64_09565 [Elusimicrobiota bacterium]
MKKLLPLLLLLSACATPQNAPKSGITPEGTQPEYVTIADFESHPNNLGGDVGVYGDGEPDWTKTSNPHSWYYDQKSPRFNEKNINGGQQSFLLINGEKGVKNGWASFAMNMGPTINREITPIEVQTLNVSSYQKLTFMVKGDKGGEKFNVIFRDSHAPDYMPQARVTLFIDGAPNQWTKVEIPLSKVSWQVDLKNLANIGIEFGSNLGNKQGAAIFLDDFRLEK